MIKGVILHRGPDGGLKIIDDEIFNDTFDNQEHYLELLNDTSSYGYVAAYSHNPEDALYGVTQDIFVKGFVLMPGEYINGIFSPYDYQEPIDNNTGLSRLFSDNIKGCENSQCWGGGDTEGIYYGSF